METDIQHFNLRIHKYGLAKSSASWFKDYTVRGEVLEYEYSLNSSRGKNNEDYEWKAAITKEELAELEDIVQRIDLQDQSSGLDEEEDISVVLEIRINALINKQKIT